MRMYLFTYYVYMHSNTGPESFPVIDQLFWYVQSLIANYKNKYLNQDASSLYICAN